jgi:uncharacterized protein YjbJ (UPF0337 family)
VNRQHAKGHWNDIKGKVKEEVGHAVGNNKMESEGVGSQVKGKIQKGLGDLKDAVKETVDKVLHPNPEK